MELIYVIMNVAIYTILGMILMMLGNVIVDLIIPCHFPTEIQKGNQAVGWISAGSFIGIGIILRAAVMSPTVEELEESLIQGICSTVVYFLVGILFFVIGYFMIKIFNRKYNLNEEISKGNTAAGIMVSGIFIGIAILVSGVIF